LNNDKLSNIPTRNSGIRIGGDDIMTLEALIIEDDPTQAGFFLEALKAVNIESEIIYDGQSALDRLAESNPAIIILDLHLPNISGLKIVEHVRSQPHLIDTRIIVATGEHRLADEIRDKVDLVMDKPVGFEQLGRLCTRVLQTD
jgi:two-component system response regulator CpxR